MLLLIPRTSALLRAGFPTRTGVHLKRVLRALNLVYEKIIIYEDLLRILFLRPQSTVQLYTSRYYSSARIGFNMNNKHHRLPVVYTMLV